MKAKEMFENLGYSLEVNNENLIKYSKEVCGYTFFRFRLKDKEFCSGYQSVAHTTTRDELKAVIQQFKELGWIEEEKREIKQETNFDHYKDRILDCCIDHLAVVKGIPKSCSKIDCNYCDFLNIKKECCEIAKDWLKQPYKKLTYKLNKFELDLLNAHKDSGMQKCISNYRPLLELHEKGYFKDIDTSTPIHEIIEKSEVVG